VHTVLLTWTRRARGERHREGELRRAFDQRLGERGFAGAGGGGEDEEFSVRGHVRNILHYSTLSSAWALRAHPTRLGYSTRLF
jgi:hypothetical protein